MPILVTGLEDVILNEAARAAEAAHAAATREAGGKAIAAIVLAVAAVEAQIGIWTVLFKDDYCIDANTLSRWKRRGPNEIIKDILSRCKPPVTVGEFRWYQCLSAFVELRNHCAHYYPEFRERGMWPERLEPYVRNGSIRPAGDDSMDWTSRLFVPSVADQAVECARESMGQFVAIAWRAV